MFLKNTTGMEWMFRDELWNNLKRSYVDAVVMYREKRVGRGVLQVEEMEWVQVAVYELWQSLEVMSWWIYLPGVVLVSCGCCNKSLQTVRLKTIEIDSLAVLEATFLEGSMGESILPCLFQLLLASGVHWLASASFQSLPPSSRGPLLCVPNLCPPFSYKDTCHRI